MKKLSVLFVVILMAASDLAAQETASAGKKQFMQITTVESVVSGGIGRSKMVITAPDGSQKESDLENLFSLVGINFKNIKENENQLVRTLKLYTDDGWKIDQVMPFTLSPGTSGGVGIFMTRYLLSRLEKS